MRRLVLGRGGRGVLCLFHIESAAFFQCDHPILVAVHGGEVLGEIRRKALRRFGLRKLAIAVGIGVLETLDEWLIFPLGDFSLAGGGVSLRRRFVLGLLCWLGGERGLRCAKDPHGQGEDECVTDHSAPFGWLGHQRILAAWSYIGTPLTTSRLQYHVMRGARQEFPR